MTNDTKNPTPTKLPHLYARVRFTHAHTIDIAGITIEPGALGTVVRADDVYSVRLDQWHPELAEWGGCASWLIEDQAPEYEPGEPGAWLTPLQCLQAVPMIDWGGEALQYVRIETTGLDVRDIVATNDPDAPGVWRVDTPNDQRIASVLVYLAGYRDASGQMIERDDHECIEAELPYDDDCACPGCGCLPGDGLTDDCEHPDGCGYLRAQAPAPEPERETTKALRALGAELGVPESQWLETERADQARADATLEGGQCWECYLPRSVCGGHAQPLNDGSQVQPVDEADPWYVAQRLADIQAQMIELVADAERLLQVAVDEGGCPRMTYERARSYWLAHIQIALSSDHNYVGGCSPNMQDTIEEIAEEA